jgi:hypothetical protein
LGATTAPATRAVTLARTCSTRAGIEAGHDPPAIEFARAVMQPVRIAVDRQHGAPAIPASHPCDRSIMP